MILKGKITYKEYRNKIKSFLIDFFNDTEENVEKFLQKEEKSIKEDYKDNPNKLNEYAWSLLYE